MAAEDTPLVAARRARLRSWIRDRFQGSRKAFLEDVAARGAFLDPTEVSNLQTGRKSFGEKKAEQVELAAGMPKDYLVRPLSDAEKDLYLPVSVHPYGVDEPKAVYGSATPAGYVRFDLFEGAAGMGAGVANADYPEVIRTVDVAEWEIRRKLGFLPAPGRMKLITGRGPSMRPKIEDGDVVMIDTSCTYFDGDDYYLINVDGEAQIKMLQKRVDGLYVVSSNPDFREWRINPSDLVVCGKALIGLGLRRL
ncbi:S24 family peptidase [Stenotrophomonas acidaminiphila]|uniref:S24 family peptidase n=1 Tax=Stenotrophomonas acidaminiphila TaxID=128780 RepID=UPI003BF4188B